MKNKIILILSMTVGVITMGVYVFMDSLKHSTDEKLIFSYDGKKVAFDENSNEAYPNLSEFKPRITGKRAYHNNVEAGYSESGISMNTLDSYGIFNTQLGLMGFNGTSSSGKRGSTPQGSTGSHVAMVLSPKSSGNSFKNMLTDNLDHLTESSSAVSNNMVAPFSSSVPGGVMSRAPGELPPPEGTPVGSGIMILLLLAGSYIIYKNKKVNAFLDKH